VTDSPKAHRYRVTCVLDGTDDSVQLHVWAFTESDARSIGFRLGLRGTITAEHVDEAEAVSA